MQAAQPCRIESANRGASSWADWARLVSEVRNSQPEYQAFSSKTWHASAGGAHAWDKTFGIGLLRRQGVWSDQIMRLIMAGVQLL